MFVFLSKLATNKTKSFSAIFLWIILIGVIAFLTPSLSEVTTNDRQDFLPVDSESTNYLQMKNEKFPKENGLPGTLVFYNESGLDNQQLDLINSFLTKIQTENKYENIFQITSIFNTPLARSNLLSEDKTTMLSIITFAGNPTSDKFEKTIEWIREESEFLNQKNPNLKIEIHLTGPAGILVDAIKVFKNIDLRITITTVMLVLVLLIIIYRSPILAILPLVIVGSSLFLSQSIAAFMSETFDLSLNGQVTGIMSVLVFGAGTNYALFIVSRYKEELLLGKDRWEAMQVTMSRIGPSIVGSAGTTIVAMIALAFATYGSFRALGPMLAIAIFVVLISGLFIMPSAIVLFGKKIFWPINIDKKIKIEKKGIWFKIGSLVANRPKMILMITILGIIITSIPGLFIKPSFNLLDGYPDSTDSKKGFEIIRDSFPKGELAPTEILVYSPEVKEIFNDKEFINSIYSNLETIEGITRISGYLRPNGYPETRRLCLCDISSAEAFYENMRFVSDDNSTLNIQIIINNDPYSLKGQRIITEIRNTLENIKLSGYDFYVGGETSVALDTKKSIDRDMTLLGPIILLAIFLILIILLKSLIAPFYLLISVIISYTATFGIAIFFFQYIFGHSGVAYANAVWMFIFLVALGADYNIYVMYRIKESTRSLGIIEGIKDAIGQTGGVVTSAGIILAGTFSILTTLPLRDLFQLGFAVSIGVLIDTFVVRAFLVPSIAVLLKDKNWWPNKNIQI